MGELNNRYGFVREIEADLIDRVIQMLKSKFGEVRGIEIGVMGAGTTRGIYRQAKALDCPCQLAGVDFEKYRPNPTPHENYKFYAGDSMDKWREIHDSYGLLFVDGCHCVNHSMTDFLNYSPLVVVGGWALFHDTALPKGQYEQESWPQDHSYAGKDPSKLGVREGLKKMGLLQGYRSDWKLMEEIPSSTGLMGMCLFEKLKEL